VEAGESLAEATAREVLEETGLSVIPSDLLGWVERRDDDWHFVILDFLAALAPDPGELVAGDDAAAAMWCPLSEVSRLELVDGLGAWLDDHGLADGLLRGESLNRFGRDDGLGDSDGSGGLGRLGDSGGSGGLGRLGDSDGSGGLGRLGDSGGSGGLGRLGDSGGSGGLGRLGDSGGSGGLGRLGDSDGSGDSGGLGRLDYGGRE